jgi:hypothetical protein
MAAQLAGVGRFALVSVLPESRRSRPLDDDIQYSSAVKMKAEIAVSRSALAWPG